MGKSELMDADLCELICKMHEAEIDAIPDAAVLEMNYTLSDTFYKRMDRMMRIESKRRNRINAWRAMVAAVAVVVLLGTLANFDTVTKAAEQFFRWMQSVVTFQFGEASDVYEIEEYTLGYVPEGYEVVNSSYMKELGQGNILYRNAIDNINLNFAYTNVTVTNGLNDEYSGYEEWTIDEEIVYVVKSEEEDYCSSMVWKNDNVIFSLTGNISLDEMSKIMQSVRLAE